MKPKHLKRWREIEGITQIKAAEELDVSRRTYQDMEAGAAKIHGHIVLACAAISLGIVPDEFTKKLEKK